MTLLGLTITRAAKPSPPILTPPQTSSGGAWIPVVREPFPGAWQQNIEVRPETVLAYFAVFSCITLIAADIGKLTLRLVQQSADGVWTETASAAFSPVLRKPNRYQTTNKFLESWITSKLIQGNTYVLKERDARGVVVALYVLNPYRVKPLIAPDGAVYYELQQHDLADVRENVVLPASEIIHDTMVTLYHPLIGVSPIYASGTAALQGLSIQGNSKNFFANGSKPGGILTAPGAIGTDAAQRAKDAFTAAVSGDNIGKVAVLGDGLHYEPMAMSAADAQLIEQLKWTADVVCSTFHVPGYMVGVGPPPPYANVEPLVQQYYSQCLQSLITNLEKSLDEGIGVAQKIDGVQFGTELDIDDLIWMDTKTRGEAAQKSAGVLSPNEARRKYYGIGAASGGNSPMVQQQYYSLDALAARDADDPFAKPPPPVAAPPPVAPPPEPGADAVEKAIRKYRGAA